MTAPESFFFSPSCLFSYYIYSLIESNMINVHTHTKRSGIVLYGRFVAWLAPMKLYLHLYLQCCLSTHTHRMVVFKCFWKFLQTLLWILPPTMGQCLIVPILWCRLPCGFLLTISEQRNSSWHPGLYHHGKHILCLGFFLACSSWGLSQHIKSSAEVTMLKR